jgi:hypothetical protein
VTFRAGRRLLAVIAGVALCASVATTAHAQSASGKPRHRKLDSVLNQLVAERTARVSGDERVPAVLRPSLRQRGLVEFGEGRVGVTIRFSGPGLAIREFVTSHGGHVAYTFDGAIEAYLDPAFLPDLDALPETDRVEAIMRAQPQITSQGVQVHNAAPWQAAGYVGQGVKVGIIDSGFVGWSSLPSADTPSLDGVRCYIGGGYYSILSYCEADSDHGTAVAEAVHDIAPGATFYIASATTNGDIHNAVQWMRQQGVRVINMSLATGWDGPGNGTSPYADSPLKAVDAAVAGGAVVTISSGNYGESSWFGSWQDWDVDYYLQFAPDVEYTCAGVLQGQTMSVQLRWDDEWGGATRDLDLELWQWATNTIMATSTDEQAGRASDVPREYATFTAPVAGYYCASVQWYGGSIPAWVQLKTRENNLVLDIRTQAGSITNPAETANPGALTVGAANWQTTSEIEAFSGSGPTPDGRIKPDIVGVDKADSFTMGVNGFAGTSQSSPHVAGLAAIIVQGYPGYTPSQIATTLKDWALVRGGAVPNNTWGYGLAYLPTVFNLTVARVGTGGGTVTGLDSLVNCGTACVQTYFSGTGVTLTANAAAGSVFSGWSGGGCTGTGTCTLTMNAVTQVTATFTAVMTPVITWPTPAGIVHGTPLSGAQLNATANVPGTFTYTPTAGTVLNAGAGQELSVLFTPTDVVTYRTATKTVTIDVSKATPGITWLAPAPIVRGTPLGALQLNAIANVPGAFVYTPAAGTVLPVGQHLLSVDFAPADSLNYQGSSASVSIDVISTTINDFSGDRKSDILWRHGTQGDVWLWAMDGGVRTEETYVRTVAEPGWEIRGLGDQTGDGTADILWRHAPTGMVYQWTMNGSTVEAETYVGTVEPAFDIVGTGDYDGDGKSDILWRHLADGQLWLWLMDGPTTRSVSYVDTVDPAYAVQGSGDLNGDGKADIVWRNTRAGDVWVWLMNGATPLQMAYVYTVGELDYRIVSVADHTGDGKADLLWHHDTRGEVWLWPMDGTTIVSQTYVDTIPDTGYRIVGNGDYNGDGNADILWHHVTRGEVWVWLMDGATRLSQTWAGSVPEVAYQTVKVK